VIWPEGALLEPVEDRPELLERLRALVDGRQLHLVFGGVRRAGRERRISALLLEPGRAARAVYDKRRLVPFAGSWPGWRPVALAARRGRLAPPRPPPPGALRAADVPFEPSLCWESAFGAPPGDAAVRLLVNLANDGWYDDTPAAHQALRAARWRAL